MGEPAGMVAVAAAIAASIGALARTTRRPRIHATGVPVLLLGWLGLAVVVLPASLRDRWPLLVAAAVVAAIAAALLARLLQGREQWLLAAGAVVLTVRVPVPTGEGRAMLLLPLYLVIAAAALVLLRREAASLRSGSRHVPDRGGATRLLDVGAAAFPALATASLTWSHEPAATAEVLAFYLVPFVLAYAVVRSWLDRGIDHRPAAAALVASVTTFACVGLWQAATRSVWWNPKVIDANRFRPDFRTNSLFWDPNMYGRALVVGLLAIVAWLLVTRIARAHAAGALAVVGLLALALWHTFSQSSWVALAAGAGVTALLTLPPRPRRWAATLVLVLLLVGTPLAADRLSDDDATGRADIVRTGLALASERPIVGWGMGTFEAAARDRAREQGDRDPGLLASHTTPVTVLAELGVVGAFAYLTLLTSVAVAVLARWRQTSTPASAARRAGVSGAPPTGWPDGAVVWAGAALAALVAHSLLYAGFFEDPTTWVALAVLASLPREVSEGDQDVPADPERSTTRMEGATAHTG